MDLATKHKAIECLDMMSRRMDEIEAKSARDDAGDHEMEEELAEGNTLPTPTQRFSDSPPDMPKENLWEGHPPVPIEHL
jgi:hypothetical protein